MVICKSTMPKTPPPNRTKYNSILLDNKLKIWCYFCDLTFELRAKYPVADWDILLIPPPPTDYKYVGENYETLPWIIGKKN